MKRRTDAYRPVPITKTSGGRGDLLHQAVKLLCAGLIGAGFDGESGASKLTATWLWAPNWFALCSPVRPVIQGNAAEAGHWGGHGGSVHLVAQGELIFAPS